MLELLTTYLRSISTKASQAARGKRNTATAFIEQALVVDAIIDGRIQSPALDEAHREILEAAEAIHFDLREYAKTLEVPIADYLRRAQHFNQVYDRANAVRALSHLLQVNPSLASIRKLPIWLRLLPDRLPKLQSKRCARLL